MKTLKRTIFPIISTTIWISLSEFVRNEYILKSYWIKHYHSLGISFPDESINGVIWGLWSLLFAISIFIISKKFSLLQTTFLSWYFGFVLMWAVIGNMGVLPIGILVYAVPLSLFETFIASFIIVELSYKPEKYRA